MPPALSIQGPLLEWAEAHRRPLPWRATRDPWAVLVSELMLQQTQVARVEPRYLAFLDRFPTVAACATASPADVIDEWAGLGYNRRAVNLHRCALTVQSEHGGAVPDSLDALLALPGIGPYTARAVLAFAYERDVAVVDTNVARILARWSARKLRSSEVQARADDLVPVGRSWAWNQGMLDLGATVCTKRTPACERCPVQVVCEWRRSGCRPPDPALGSAFVGTGQSPFDGSDRQGRGRLVGALRERGRVDAGGIARAAGWPDEPDRARRVAEALVRDGLAAWTGDGGLRLPG